MSSHDETPETTQATRDAERMKLYDYQNAKSFNQMPGPMRVPGTGPMKTIGYVTSLNNLYNAPDIHGDFFRVGPNVFTADPGMMKIIVADDVRANKERVPGDLGRGNTVATLALLFEKPSERDYQQIEERGAYISLKTNQLWRDLNAATRERFRPNTVLKDQAEVIYHQTDNMIERLINTQGAPINILDYLKDLSLNIILDGQMGIKPDRFQRDIYFPLVQSALSWGIFPSQLGIDPVRTPFLRAKVNGFREDLYEFALNNILAISEGENTLIASLRKSFPDNLNLQIAAIHELISAAFETIAGNMTFAVEELAAHPEIQEWIFNSLEGIDINDKFALRDYMSDPNNPISLLHNEVLRTYPPTFIVPWSVENPNGLVLGGYHLPAGTNGQLIYYRMLRDPKYWTDPETFDITRFIEGSERFNPMQSIAFHPFHEGPRGCVGEHAAKLQFAVVMSSLVRNFNIVSSTRKGINTMTGVLHSKGNETILEPRSRSYAMGSMEG